MSAPDFAHLSLISIPVFVVPGLNPEPHTYKACDLPMSHNSYH